MSARWVREELENRRIADRFLSSQTPTTPKPQCLACGRQFDQCIATTRDGDTTFQCMLQRGSCWSDNHCL
jgi:hypothetical protein